MYDGIKTEMKIVSQKDVKSLLSVKAPHFIAVFSEPREGYLTNVGFMLQQMDLYLSANNIGSCWQGILKPTKEILKSSKFEFVIILAFGKPTEPLHREGVSEFKRKPLGEISNIHGSDELLEPARLAPSAMNNQPWFFTGGDGAINAYCAKSLMLGKMNRISTGIAICHLWIATGHLGKNPDFISDRAAQEHPPAKYDYVTTLKVK
jgi:hypothetical protein